MCDIINWVKKQIIIFYVSLVNVDKNLLNQNKRLLDDNEHQTTKHTQGQIADSLLNGELTKEVVDLRWRTYKILKETNGLESVSVGFDSDGFPIIETKKINRKHSLSKIKLDDYDNYELEMVVDNTPITVSITDTLKTIFENDTVNNLDHQTSIKNKYPIIVKRMGIGNFDIEKYTKKLNVRIIDNNKRLLEFYISSYKNDENLTQKLFLKKLRKSIDNPNYSNIFNIDSINFITDKTIGVQDLLEFEYTDLKYDKTIQFDGYYVVKFIGTIEKNGIDMTTIYLSDGLEIKYKNKDKKKLWS